MSNSKANSIVGGIDADTINDVGGNDTLTGSNGEDVIYNFVPDQIAICSTTQKKFKYNPYHFKKIKNN